MSMVLLVCTKYELMNSGGFLSSEKGGNNTEGKCFHKVTKSH